MPKMSLGVVWALAGVAALAAITVASFFISSPLTQGFQISNPAERPFHFVASNERHIPHSFLRGRPTAWVFGFSRCGAPCRATLERLDELTSRLDDASGTFNFVFVRIDPEHDTPAILRSYLSGHTPKLVALVGSRQMVEGMANYFRMAFTKGASTRTFPKFADLSRIFLTDHEGRLIEGVELEESYETGVAELQRTAAGRP